VTDTENEITADLIAELLREQHPDLADLPLTFGARGWDNQLWRLGDDLAVRLPWQGLVKVGVTVRDRIAWRFRGAGRLRRGCPGAGACDGV